MNKKIDQIISSAISDGNISDIYLSVYDYKNHSYCYKYEFHDSEKSRFFDLASLTKFVVIFRMFIENKVVLDSKVSDYLSELSEFPNISSNDARFTGIFSLAGECFVTRFTGTL